MKLLILALTCAAAVWARPGETYSDKYDTIDVNEVLQSERLLKGYVECLLDKGRCTPDGKELKDTLPDALEHECSKCTEKQKSGADTVIRHLVNKRPELWKELAVKYDPENIYQERYKDRLESVKEH
uniref:Allergen Tha p 1 n=1 Tax=Thaumetopoea pityocampa TaxID=208016 RepID=THAP1_THAPI|nr:RecName: Full=Allergen Tha p 1; AltName: Allergen=Tha p 1; Flags: Precursor [Thaumetopoea pityocampa]ADK47876.1 Tha p 1 allergen [Thaumetopoea pityocampa]CCJ09295.1 Tha p1 [Thaumetopoea pityocampa]